MTLEEFRDCTRDAAPPPGLSPALLALWHAARGDWDRAHAIAQEVESRTGAWVHAYLHRKEGDLGNAAYWYRRAGRAVAEELLEEEWDAIVSALLDEA